MNEKLIQSGANANLMGLRQEGPQHVKLGRLYEEALARVGWTPGKTDELELYGLELETVKSSQLEARTESKIKTKTEAKLRGEGKRVIRLIRNVLPLVLEELDEAEAEAFEATFRVGEPIGRSTPRTIAYLTKTKQAVKTLDDAFRPYFNGESVYSMYTSILDRLSGADAAQEFARSQLPADTRAFYELKGRVLKLITTMNRLAKNAFDGQAYIIGQFNKDLLLRATRSRAMPEVELESPLTEVPAIEEAAIEEPTSAATEVVPG